MVKSKANYYCQQCGTVHSKWVGQCQGCQSWNTLIEETESSLPKNLTRSKGHTITFTGLQGEVTHYDRLTTVSDEFNRVCGGGLVHGSVTLIGGDPGIGKSTLLLQLAASLATVSLVTNPLVKQKQSTKNVQPVEIQQHNVQQHNAQHQLPQFEPTHNVVYISGEEAIDQIRMRASRLGVASAPINLAAHTHMTDIISSLKKMPNTKLVIIDSIQTMYVDTVESIPGTVSQVKAATHDLIQYAKKSDVAVILIGHVTKEGTLAGPRVLEHMVDTVLYFEGERGNTFRILRSVKNRFGATDEIGVFSMTEKGLQDVTNPSELFLGNRTHTMSGSAVFAGIEGTRPLLVEIQGLISPSSYGTPRRTVVGWDNQRLAMVLAVIETRCGIPLGMRDVYLSITGGLKISEPAIDLAVAAALLSSLYDQPLPEKSLFCGEIGLSGEIRPISYLESRLKEAAKLGFKTVYVPKNQVKAAAVAHLEIIQLSTLQEFVKVLFDKMPHRG